MLVKKSMDTPKKTMLLTPQRLFDGDTLKAQYEKELKELNESIFSSIEIRNHESRLVAWADEGAQLISQKMNSL